MSSSLSANMESILDRFDDAWNGPMSPCIEDYLAEAAPDRRLPLLIELVRIDLERRLAAGERARLEETYQRRFPELFAEPPAIVTLVKHEYAVRRRNEPDLTPAEYLKRFPQCQADLVAQLSTLNDIPDGERQLKTADTLAGLDLRGYELIETLGEGGMGEVYRCVDPSLGRDLAIKIMKAAHRGHPERERRFLREARVTGSLQHPGIVPVHNLGRLKDGRLHYTMRLVRGRTLAEILKDEAGKPEHLPDLLSIFEKICQAVAYAHSKQVIHRDLKPHNVMVGKFGEVQVMDWGLAKVLTADDSSAETEEPTDTAGTRIFTESADTPVDLSRVGIGLGTLQYMPSEQARGKWKAVDERADVFALGSILCEILTGQPAYTGTNVTELCDRVERGDVAESLQRLYQCGADEPLTTLCSECLSLKREDRPRDAAVVAKRVAEYQAEVQERLRQAELERVAAETRSREEQARAIVEQERTREALARVKAERRARQRTLALAAAILVLLASGGAGAWWVQQVRAAAQVRQNQTDREALAAVERARERLEEGWRLHDLTKLAEAKTEAERAADIARSGGASDAVDQQVVAFQAEVQQRRERYQKNASLLRDLLDIAIPHDTGTDWETKPGRPNKPIKLSVEEQYAAAFRQRWPDVDIDKQTASEAVSRLQEEPAAVLQAVIAGLDSWMVERRRQQRSEAGWRRLHELVERLDPSEPRQRLRTLLVGGVPPPAASVVGLLGGRPSWPALWELARGNDWRSLRQLRSQFNAADESVLTVLLLAQASSSVGDMAGAEEVLRQALARRPDEVALLDALGKVLEREKRLTEAVGCYRAARACAPIWGSPLA